MINFDFFVDRDVINFGGAHRSGTRKYGPGTRAPIASAATCGTRTRPDHRPGRPDPDVEARAVLPDARRIGLAVFRVGPDHGRDHRPHAGLRLDGGRRPTRQASSLHLPRPARAGRQQPQAEGVRYIRNRKLASAVPTLGSNRSFSELGMAGAFGGPEAASWARPSASSAFRSAQRAPMTTSRPRRECAGAPRWGDFVEHGRDHAEHEARFRTAHPVHARDRVRQTPRGRSRGPSTRSSAPVGARHTPRRKPGASSHDREAVCPPCRGRVADLSIIRPGGAAMRQTSLENELLPPGCDRAGQCGRCARCRGARP